MAELRILENNHTFYGYEFGDRTLPTLVCLHGMTSDANSFNALVRFLTRDFHLILLDLPGHGRTEAYNEEKDYLFSSVAKRIDKVLNQVATKPLYILGHSWGADLSLHYAKAFPEKVKGIVLIDGGYVFPEQVEGLTLEKAVLDWDEYIDSSRYQSWEDVVKDYQGYITKKWDINLDSIIHSNFNNINGEYVLRADKFSLLSTVKAFYKEPSSTTYEDIQCPVLMLHATVPEIDPSRDRGLHTIKKSINNIKVIGIENTKHNIHWDDPQEVAEKLLLWKQQIEKNIE